MVTDSTVGKLVLTATFIFFIYYSFWVLLLPFADKDDKINNFFPPVWYALVIPAVMGMFFIGGLAAFTLCAVENVADSKMWLIVGVSGVTCGGKSSLACALHEAFPSSVLVSQDDFFLPVNSPMHVSAPGCNHHNWEILSSLDMARMEATIKGIISEDTVPVKILIIEGFLIFNHEVIGNLCNYKYYITLPRNECWARRSIRKYDPPDPPGYFDKCVWPEYERHRDEALASKKDIILLDGRESFDGIIQKVISEISSAIDHSKVSEAS